MLPQQATSPDSPTAQEWYVFALIVRKLPDGESVWPAQLLPQQTISPVSRMAQVWKAPAPTWVYAPCGFEVSVPQQSITPDSRNAQAWKNPALTATARSGSGVGDGVAVGVGATVGATVAAGGGTGDDGRVVHKHGVAGEREHDGDDDARHRHGSARDAARHLQRQGHGQRREQPAPPTLARRLPPGRQLLAVGEVQLREHGRDVRLDRLRADAQALRDFGVGAALAECVEHAPFGGREDVGMAGASPAATLHAAMLGGAPGRVFIPRPRRGWGG